jgi:hypothetical protein
MPSTSYCAARGAKQLEQEANYQQNDPDGPEDRNRSDETNNQQDDP